MSATLTYPFHSFYLSIAHLLTHSFDLMSLLQLIFLSRAHLPFCFSDRPSRAFEIQSWRSTIFIPHVFVSKYCNRILPWVPMLETFVCNRILLLPCVLRCILYTSLSVLVSLAKFMRTKVYAGCVLPYIIFFTKIDRMLMCYYLLII
jgi:hypothetical protein